MGVAAGDFDNDGWLDILKTNFSDEAPNLYHNQGKAIFSDVTAAAGLNRRTHFVGWGCGFFDPDNDGLADILYCNGHVYPELERMHADTTYRQPRVLYRNLGSGRFEDVSLLAGPGIITPTTGRGCAFGDFNNDGRVDVVVNNQNTKPSLLRITGENQNHWINIHLVGTRSNRSAIGARVRCVAGPLAQIDEVRSGGSYLSQNDLRLHFGLRDRSLIDLVEIRWPSGAVDQLHSIPADQFIRARGRQAHHGASSGLSIQWIEPQPYAEPLAIRARKTSVGWAGSACGRCPVFRPHGRSIAGGCWPC